MMLEQSRFHEAEPGGCFRWSFAQCCRLLLGTLDSWCPPELVEKCQRTLPADARPLRKGRKDGSRTASRSSSWKPGATNQVRDFEVIAKQHHTSGAHMAGLAIFVAVCDVLCNHCINDLLSPDPSFPFPSLFLRDLARETRLYKLPPLVGGT